MLSRERTSGRVTGSLGLAVYYDTSRKRSLTLADRTASSACFNASRAAFMATLSRIGYIPPRAAMRKFRFAPPLTTESFLARTARHHESLILNHSKVWFTKSPRA